MPAFALRRPLLTVVIIAIVTAAAGLYAAKTLALESDTTKLIPQNVKFLRNYNAFKHSLPDQRRLNVVVIDGGNPDSVAWAVRSLAQKLEKRNDLFRRVYAPQFSDFSTQYGVLNADFDTLVDISDALLDAQPIISILSRAPTLSGLAELATLTGQTQESADAEQFQRFSNDLNAALVAFQAGKPMPFSWRSLLLGTTASPTRGILVVQGLLDDEAAKSAGIVGSVFIRNAAAELGIDEENGLVLRMTGRGALSHEELQSALDSVQVAGLISLGLLALILWSGFRSFSQIAACLITLLSGLVLTAAAAAATVGTLNFLSVAFAILFLGLGIDFAIHVLLRLTEPTTNGDPGAVALSLVRGTGRAVGLAATTTAIGFLSFIPTEYKGLAELGLISALGLAIAVLLSFSLLPALFRVFRSTVPSAHLTHNGSSVSSTRATNWLGRHRGVVFAVAIGVAVGGAGLATQTSFDFNTLGLKGSSSESVQTYLDLQKDGWITSYSLSVLVSNEEAAAAAKRKLESLPEVAHVTTPADRIPTEQDDKLLVLEDTAFALWPSLNPPDKETELSIEERREAVQRLIAAFEAFDAKKSTAESKPQGNSTQSILGQLAEDPGSIVAFEAQLMRHLPQTLNDLVRALSAEPLDLESLPENIRGLDQTVDGRLRVAVSPNGILTEHKQLKAFVSAVQAHFPDATGTPALEVGIADIIVDAFLKALVIALGGVAAVLLFVLRSVKDTALVMTPLILAGIATTGAGVLFDLPFNFANIIVLPLILGLGVDNGVHMIMRWREEQNLASVISSTTPRAILMSGLTTAASFGTLSIAENQGLASMGQLLLIGITAVLLSTILLLPALLSKLPQRPSAPLASD